jgi:hypothetical protein
MRRQRGARFLPAATMKVCGEPLPENLRIGMDVSLCVTTMHGRESVLL